MKEKVVLVCMREGKNVFELDADKFKCPIWVLVPLANAVCAKNRGRLFVCVKEGNNVFIREVRDG